MSICTAVKPSSSTVEQASCGGVSARSPKSRTNRRARVRWLTDGVALQWQAQKPPGPDTAAASPGSSNPVGKAAPSAAGESSGKKRKKRRRDAGAAEGTAGASLAGQADDIATAAQFRAPPSLSAGNPFAVLMRDRGHAKRRSDN